MKKLDRSLELQDVVAISMSMMIGSGLFILPGLAFTMTGPSLWAAYFLSSICVLPASFSKAELGTAMPTSGGSYVYLERTFGPFAGTILGLGLWLSLLLKSAFALIGFSAYFSILTSFDIRYTALALLGLISVINILGVGKVSKLLTISLIFSLICILTMTFGHIITTDKLNNSLLQLDNGISGIISATALVFVSFAGVTKASAIADEIKDPEKNLPRGILLSLLLTTLLYCLITMVLVKVLPANLLSNNLKPLYSMGVMLWGKSFGVFVCLFATTTLTSMSNAGILAASRFPLAMARDNLLPPIISKIHGTLLTPINSILLTSLIVGLSIFFLDVIKIAKLASVFIILIYVLENIAVIILRESHVQWYRPKFKSPFYPIIQIFGIISGITLMCFLGNTTILAIIIITTPGILLYFSYSKYKVSRMGIIRMRGARKDLIKEAQYLDKQSDIQEIDLSGDSQVVVSLLGNEKSPELLVEMGVALSNGSHLESVHLTEVPKQTDLEELIKENAHIRSLRRRIINISKFRNIPITFDPVVTHDIIKSIFEISQRLHCKWLIMEWAGWSRDRFTIMTPTRWLESHLQCNLAIFKDNGVKYIKKILVILRPNLNNNLMLDTAVHLSLVYDAEITVGFSYESQNDHDLYNSIEQKVNSIKNQLWKKIVFTKENHMDSIINASVANDLMIFEMLPTHGKRLVNDIFGTFDDKLIQKSACSTLMIKTFF